MHHYKRLPRSNNEVVDRLIKTAKSIQPTKTELFCMDFFDDERPIEGGGCQTSMCIAGWVTHEREKEGLETGGDYGNMWDSFHLSNVMKTIGFPDRHWEPKHMILLLSDREYFLHKKYYSARSIVLTVCMNGPYINAKTIPEWIAVVNEYRNVLINDFQQEDPRVNGCPPA